MTVSDAPGRAANWAQVLLDPAPVGRLEGTTEPTSVRYAEIPVERIRPNPRQPREVFDEEALAELAASIAAIGLLQPVVVRPDGEAGSYVLVAGERRWRAVSSLGHAVIPAVVRPTADEDLLRDALLENLHRAALNPLEEAAAYQQLLADFGCTQDELAARVGRSRPHVSNTIRLLRLPTSVQRRVAAGVISGGHARALLALPDAASMEALATRIVAEGLSVRSVEEIVAVGGATESPPRSRRPRRAPTGLESFADRLAERLDTRVQVTMGRAKGRVTIEFAGIPDLERILSVLTAEDGTPE